jgi:hypothetical protein
MRSSYHARVQLLLRCMGSGIVAKTYTEHALQHPYGLELPHLSLTCLSPSSTWIHFSSLMGSGNLSELNFSLRIFLAFSIW